MGQEKMHVLSAHGYKNAEFYAGLKCFEVVLKNVPSKSYRHVCMRILSFSGLQCFSRFCLNLFL